MVSPINRVRGLSFNLHQTSPILYYYNKLVKVGKRITPPPPHRPRRAVFSHRVRKSNLASASGIILSAIFFSEVCLYFPPQVRHEVSFEEYNLPSTPFPSSVGDDSNLRLQSRSEVPRSFDTPTFRLAAPT